MRKALIAMFTGLMVSLTAVAAAGAPAAPRAAAPAAPRAAVQGTSEALAIAATGPDSHNGPGSCIRVGTKGKGGGQGFLCVFHGPPEGFDCHTYVRVPRVVGAYNCFQQKQGRGLAVPALAAGVAVNGPDIKGGCGPLGDTHKVCVLQTRPADGSCTRTVVKVARVFSIWRCGPQPEVARRIA